MLRRNQFNGVYHDILGTFLSRYNDLDGYWALGQYVSFLEGAGKKHMQFKLGSAIVIPGSAIFVPSVVYYRGAITRMMQANAMPLTWFVDAVITLSIISSTKASCEIEIISDLGGIYRYSRAIDVRSHDPGRELQRATKFGPSNQKGQ